jgi:hypothetical protein
MAVLGDDGRWHLRSDEEWLCIWTQPVPASASIVRHEQWCGWWTDGVRYRVGPPGDHNDGTGDMGCVDVAWAVTVTTDEIDPACVPPRERCRSSRWPAYAAAKSAVVRIRSRLIAELGPTCAGCGVRLGTIVDHDHLTWMVRGLLCTNCNTHIDDCPHLAGCQWGDYLADPPAAKLSLRYPRPDGAAIEQHTLKVAKLGYDPLAHLAEWQTRAGYAPNAKKQRSGGAYR